MSSRYSDRFFPRDDARPRGHGANPSAENLGGGRPDDPWDATPLAEGASRSTVAFGPECRQPWHGQRSARAAVVFAAVLGAGVGAYGWEQWRVHQADLAARATVDVSTGARFLTASLSGEQLLLTMNLHNDGRYPVTFTGVIAADPRVQLSDRGASYSVEVAADDGVGVSIQMTVNCLVDTEGRTSRLASDGPLSALVRTVDGREHDVPVPLEGFGEPSAQVIDNMCAATGPQQHFTVGEA